MRGLYIHVPFCLSKCPYCDFYSVRYSKSLAADYTKAVIHNLKQYDEPFDTVYFGGGTPVLLSDEIGEMLKAVNIAENAEITVEANPCISDIKRLSALRNSGVNRISFGVQSMDDNELKFLGRRHTAEQAIAAINLANEVGFDNISADLMLGLQGQKKGGIAHSVDVLASLPVSHISAYLLKIEEGTPFAEMDIDIPEDDELSELYLYTCEQLEKSGFMQYEISNFSKSGAQCRHNLKYWRCEEYLGIGPAAHSFYKGKRFCTERDIEKFILSDIQEITITDDTAGDFEEYAMLKLRLTEGLTFEECESYGVTRAVIENRCRKIPDEYYSINEKGVSLTKNGFLLSNAVIGRVLGY